MKSMLDYLDQCEPLTEDMSKAFIVCTTNEMQGTEAPEEAKAEFPFQVMQKRLNIGKIPVSPWTLMFLAMLCDNVAKMVMCAHMCVEIYRKDPLQEVNMSSLAHEFPLGFPTDAAMKDCWDQQKGMNNGLQGVDNILDTKKPWILS